MKRRNQFELQHCELGASLVEFAIVLPLFVLLMLGAIDIGRAIYEATEIAGAAQAAAVYGSQNPTDTTGMTNAAKSDAPAVTNLSVTNAAYGCECSDGTFYNASCAAMPSCSTTTQVYRVNVTVTGTYTPLFPWPGVPSSIALSSSASMRSAGS
jgi:Flp pilus assembly protein TadG